MISNRDRLAGALLETDHGDGWRQAAACGRHDEDLWFSTAPAHIAAAKSICRNECPVRQRCLTQTLTDGDDFGVFGGLDENERRALRRAARPRSGAFSY